MLGLSFAIVYGIAHVSTSMSPLQKNVSIITRRGICKSKIMT